MAEQAESVGGKETFMLNEVCKLVNVQPHMLRIWGAEFGQLEPYETDDGKRFLNREQVGLIFEIRRLLVEERLSIAGAREWIRAADENRSIAETRLRPAPKYTARSGGDQAKKMAVTKPRRSQIDAEIAEEVRDRLEPLLTLLAVHGRNPHSAEVVGNIGLENTRH